MNERAIITYDPTPANAGPVWAWHAAPEWERQCRNLSPWAWAETYRTPTYWAWARFGLRVTLRDTVNHVDKMYLFAFNTLHL